ncbi:MAG: hypothetical protein R3F56_11775 [Planctomycetota bacterium]
METRRSPRPPLVRRVLAWAAALVLAVSASTQIQVRYGEPARTGTITMANETQRYLLAGGQQGDTLRVSFCSQTTCCPTYYLHQIDLWQGTTHLGGVQGVGTFTVSLPTTGFYTLEVRARNNQSTGWYAFQLDRLNDPAAADRIAFNWNIQGALAARAEFDVYTLHATAGESALLRFTCQTTCCPTYYIHFAQLVDAAGTEVAAVAGNGSMPFTIPATGTYTLFVAARNYESAGWYTVSVDCQSWPFTPCDTVAHASNYGQGSMGTNGVPSLTATAPPRLGQVFPVSVGNSWGQATAAGLLIGPSAANVAVPTYGATLLVAYPSVVMLALPPAGATVGFPLPNDPLLLGIGVAMQSLVADPNATSGIAFSRGLVVVFGP